MDCKAIHFTWRDLLNKVRTSLKNYDGLIYIPDLKSYMAFEVKQPSAIKDTDATRDNSEEAILDIPLNEHQRFF